ncbi:anti-sigma factor [Pelagibius sp.]|uniref:anti-sigma factor n=1 Tax=Pelagibius sp. TaxID=1931238 RepID=UPI003B50E707
MVSVSRDRADLLAAEFVLGSLDRAARRAAARRYEEDRDFADRVDLWAERLFPLTQAMSSELPEDTVWAGIEAEVNGQTAAEAAAQSVPVPRRAFPFALLGWGGTALAAALALFLLTPLSVEPPRRDLVASLEAADSGLAWEMALERTEGRLTLQRRGAWPAAPDQSLELWLISAEGRVRSLGLLPPAAEAALALDDQALESLRPGATLAVSREPLGGSPGAGPSGPVILSAGLRLP